MSGHFHMELLLQGVEAIRRPGPHAQPPGPHGPGSVGFLLRFLIIQSPLLLWAKSSLNLQ